MTSRRDFVTSAAGIAAGAGILVAQAQRAEAQTPPTAAGKSKLDEVRARGKVIVGVTSEAPPFGFIDEKGEIVGFDIDVVKAVAAKAGIEVKFVNTPWEGIFNALAQGDRDIVVSSVTITPERRQTMDFSAPYFDAVQYIVVKEDSKVKAFADLKPLKVGDTLKVTLTFEKAGTMVVDVPVREDAP